MTRERVRALLEDGLSISEIARTLALSKSTVCYHARRLGRPPTAKFATRYDWSSIRRYYESGFSATQCMHRFGFSGSAWSDAVARGDIVLRPAEEELQLRLSSGRPVSRGYVKRQLLRLGLKHDACERCGVKAWRGRRIVLALHHVNGDGGDNRLVNLQLLCPNCHSQTENFAGRAVPLRRAKARERARIDSARVGVVPLGPTQRLEVVGRTV